MQTESRQLRDKQQRKRDSSPDRINRFVSIPKRPDSLWDSFSLLSMYIGGGFLIFIVAVA